MSFMGSKIEELIKEAEEFVIVAEKEFNEAIRENDKIRIRDSAEKAWNAIVQVTNALIIALTGKTPMSHYERRVMLRELEKTNVQVKELGFRDRYMARYKILHGETFYEGIIDIEELKVEFEKVHSYIEDAKKLLKGILLRRL